MGTYYSKLTSVSSLSARRSEGHVRSPGCMGFRSWVVRSGAVRESEGVRNLSQAPLLAARHASVSDRVAVELQNFVRVVEARDGRIGGRVLPSVHQPLCDGEVDSARETPDADLIVIAGPYRSRRRSGIAS